MTAMTTTPPAIAPARRASETFLGDQRIVIRGVDADLYNRLDAAIGEGQHVRLAYDGKDLELMTTGHIHERLKDRIGSIIKAVILAWAIPCMSCGQKTWKTEKADRGLEADLSYYFDPEKIRVAREAEDRGSTDPADYPTGPDLSVEIDISSPQVDRPTIYRALRAVEVWRFNGRALVIEQLQPDGTYAVSEESRFLRIRPDEVMAWLTAEDVGDEEAWTFRLFQWALNRRRQAP
jgi:Uma2 family endonuclease